MSAFLTETEFLRAAEAELVRWTDRLEAADAAGALEAELEGGTLTIGLPGGKTYLLSRHAPSRELWVSSPISGGLHFAWKGAGWALPDGRTLEAVMREELNALANIEW